MKKLLFLTAIGIIAFTHSVSAQSLWTQTNGPTNGSTNSMSVDSLQRIYVCTGGAGVFQSTDHGTTWHGLNKGLRILPMRWLESSTIQTGPTGAVAYVYAVSQKKELLRREVLTLSVDAQWKYLDSIVGGNSVLDINQIMTNAKGYLYVATANFGVVRSRDNGDHFDPVLNLKAPKPDSFIQCMTVDRHQNLYAVSIPKNLLAQVYRSTDDGDSWQKLPTPPPDGFAIDKMVVADDGSICLAYYGGDFTNSCYVIRSSDLGNTWDTVFTQPPGHDNNIDQIRHAPKGSDLYMNTHGPTYRSTDNGAHWVARNLEKMGDEPFDLVMDSINSVFQCAIPDGIFKSVDSGLTYNNIDQTLLVQHLDGGTAVDSAGVIYCSSQFNIYVSTDQGNSWNQAPDELDEGQIQILECDREDTVYYGCSSGMFRSSNHGMKFDTVIYKNNPTGLLSTNQIYYVGISPKDELFASCSAGIDGKSNVPWFVRSTDHGTTWTRINASNDPGYIPTILPIYAVGFSVGGNGDTIYASGNTNNIYKSVNNGVNWDIINSEGNGITKFICHPDGSVFRLENRTNGGLLRSVDGGVTWTKIFPDTTTASGRGLDTLIQTYWSMMLDRKGRILISTADTSLVIGGYYLSTDATFTHWANMSSGCFGQDYYPDRPFTVTQFAQDSRNGVYYAGTRGASVFKSVPDLILGVPLSPLSSSVLAEPVNYPNPFNKSTQISFTIGKSGTVKISIYDVMGRLMQVLHDGYMSAGEHTLAYDASSMISNG